MRPLRVNPSVLITEGLKFNKDHIIIGLFSYLPGVTKGHSSLTSCSVIHPLDLLIYLH